MESVTQLLLIKQLKDRLDAAEWQQGEQGIKGETGMVGPQGMEGRAGRDGQDGTKGKDGSKGVDGKAGKDGEDGVSITDAYVAADGELVFTLSDGSELSVNLPSTGTQQYISRTGGGGGGVTKAMNPVDNIVSYSFDITAANNVLKLALDRCRTFFAIGVPTDRFLKIWIGDINPPPADISTWFTVVDGYTLPDGVLGPIYIAELSNQASTVYLMSTIDEEEHATIGPLATVVSVCELTDELGNPLTDDDGNFIVYPG